MKITVKIGEQELEVLLNDSVTARQLGEILPLESKALLWGEEIYFYIPRELAYEELVEVVDVGDFAYWPEGPCLCLFIGKTPISKGDEIKPASGVSICGRILNLSSFNLSLVKGGAPILISASE